MLIVDTGPFVAVADVDDADHGVYDLIRTYADLPLGVTDASLIALAERLRVERIATLDHRHFRVVRPTHRPAFTLVP